MNFLTAKSVTFLCLVSLPLAGLSQIQNFDSLNGYAAGPDNRLMVVRDRALDGLADAADNRVFLRGRYVNREIDPASERFERDSDGLGMRAGVFGGDGVWSLGLDIDYEDMTTDYLELNPPGPLPNRGTVDTQGYQFALNVLGHQGPWRFGVQGGFGRADHDATRRSDAETSRANYDSQEEFAVARLEHVLAFENKMEVTPFVAVSTARVKVDGFREKGTSPDRRVIEDFTLRENLGVLGVRVSRQWERMHPAFSVSWVNRLSGNNSDLSSTAANGLDPRSGEVDAPYSDLVVLELSVDVLLGQNWWLRPDFRYLQGGDDTQWMAGLGLGRRL